EPLSIEQRARNEGDLGFAVRLAKQAVDHLFEAGGGGGGLFNDRRVPRSFDRDWDMAHRGDSDDIRATDALMARQFQSAQWTRGRSADWTAFAADYFPGAPLYPAAHPRLHQRRRPSSTA
ncbi:MAG: hypothetical protein VX741_03165, partial [Pseudomonadota bacterium]|nr:hypothetical protein [Pseudomonadota bacterium]